ncbi:uncharacterized protein VICG_01270 [Vittaforma corneae ATCC 50505]|uniref:Uncharacterized protein n=1 Tax=Vittaforma corneae (strain ATCC 50505) TaxID=993615 RepID=L2GMW3_VITCO|nr:uncharacterized protein VICG_01270 [Vittaforma corneae ATCC 50505]ELA41637.1 hypothetical protein VICG_01270 [Vittaforma corneae ATCC 50505]
MGSRENARKQPSTLSDRKLLDPFAELFTGTISKGQIVKEDTVSLGKSMDDILFSKIDPLDLSFGKNTSKASKGSIVFDEDSNAKGTKGCSLRDDPILSSFLSPKNTEKVKESTSLFNSISKNNATSNNQSDKLGQELLSLLSTRTNTQSKDIKPTKPPAKNRNSKNTSSSNRDIGLEIFESFICNNGALMDTPKSPYSESILSNSHRNAKNKVNKIKKSEDLAKTTNLKDENIKNSNFSVENCFNVDPPINTESSSDHTNLKDNRTDIAAPVNTKFENSQITPCSNITFRPIENHNNSRNNHTSMNMPPVTKPINVENIPMNISNGFAAKNRYQQAMNPFESLYNVNYSGTPQNCFKPVHLQQPYSPRINTHINNNFYPEHPSQHPYGLVPNFTNTGYCPESRRQRIPYKVKQEPHNLYFKGDLQQPFPIRQNIQQRPHPIKHNVQQWYPVRQDFHQYPYLRYDSHQPYSNARSPHQMNNMQFIKHSSNVFLNKPINCVAPFNRDIVHRFNAVRLADKGSHLTLRIKLFSLRLMDEDKRMLIDKLSLTVDNLKYRFFRTLNEVADILELPKLSYHDAHELRILFNLFSKCGGYLNANAHFLNYVKNITKKYFFKYLSYVLPLETSGYFYKPKIKLNTKRKVFKPTKEELNSVLCIGIYDDIFYFLDLLEQGEISGALMGELLNMFFLVSDHLFKSSGCTLPLLDKIVGRLNGKPYKVVLDRMSRDILYQLQEQIFRIILKYEKNKKSDQSFNDDTLFCIIELILQRKMLKKLSNIADLDTEDYRMKPSSKDLSHKYENEYLWTLMLIDAVNSVIRPTPRILDILFEFDGADPSLILRVSSKFLLDSQTVQRIFLKHEAYIIAMLEKHMKTLENMILLNDEKELEIIITYFLPFLFVESLPLMSILNTVVKYKEYLLEKKVYFRKRRSSNIDTIIKCLKGRLSGG